MFAKIRKQQLQSYSFHSRDRPPASHVEMWWDSKKKYLKIVNSSDDDKGLGWAAEGGDENFIDPFKSIFSFVKKSQLI